MKTAVSIPDDVFEQAERLASRLRISRSRLYAQALRSYVKQREPASITEAMNQALTAADTDKELPAEDTLFVSASAARVLAATEW